MDSQLIGRARQAIARSNQISRSLSLEALYRAKHVQRCWIQSALMLALEAGKEREILALTCSLERQCRDFEPTAVHTAPVETVPVAEAFSAA